MLRFYPSFSHELKNFSEINGSEAGILKSIMAPVTKMYKEPFLKSMTGSMPHYHRFILDEPESDMNYHLSGYGQFYQEALVKFNGESVERYAGVVSSSYAVSDVKYDTYSNISKLGKAMPLKYINIFTPEQQKRISELLPQYSPEHLKEDQVIGWVKCRSLVRPGEDIWIPRQQVFVGYNRHGGFSEPMIVPSFSTGTASHKTLKKALINAITEYLQIDSFILTWYTMRKARRVEIDHPVISDILQKAGLGLDGSYEVLPLLISMPDMDIPIYMAILLRKEERMPYMVVGTQGDMDAENGVMRGIMEAAAILSMNTFMMSFDAEKFDFALNESAFTDLDTNVYFYAAPRKIEEKRRIVKQLTGESIPLSSIPSLRGQSTDAILESLIAQVKNVSEYAAFLDITPPEIIDKGWSVVRVFIPEICGMCLPGFPFKNHPRMQRFGGVVNAYPHPLP
ncbi:MAG TPA: YcaO-like family protein [Clostridia bacterium]|nr:YcaO-like family protein [Clostridia bacterium]